MKRFVLGTMAVTMVFASVAVATAKGPAGVSNTIHNLSASAPDDTFAPGAPGFYKTDEPEVCIFCHTPHGGTLTGPLWNHDEVTNAFTHYNSATLSTYIKGLGVGRALGDESMLCMSCHDGSVSVYALHNYSRSGVPVNVNSGTSNDTIIYMPGVPNGNIGGGTLVDAGGDLSDDHPISFSYAALLASGEYAPLGSKANRLRTLADAVAHGVAFGGSNHDQVECSSCHDPHVDYLADPAYTPFLITPNAGSNLCLACHIK